MILTEVMAESEFVGVGCSQKKWAVNMPIPKHQAQSRGNAKWPDLANSSRVISLMVSPLADDLRAHASTMLSSARAIRIAVIV
jgi:hypothetical protein